MRTIEVFASSEELGLRAAELFVEIANAAVRERGWFAVALAGGSTPQELYRLLGTEAFADRVDWSKGKYFIGDERNVAENSAESNYRMVRENLIEPLAIDTGRLFGWDVREARLDARSASKVADGFKTKLEGTFRHDNGEIEVPKFDLILLGLGSDAHTASLFPGTEALHETEKPAVVNWVEKLDSFRYTLTFLAINNAANVIFLVAGKGKAEAVRDVLEGERRPDAFPAQSVELQNGRLYWLLDKEAASLLSWQ